jgi:hypothetical protein
MSVLERPPVDERRQLEEDLGRLNRLIEASRTEEARALAPQLAARWPDSPEIRHLAHVLEPPRVVPNDPRIEGRSFERDHAWLAEHANEYPGCWIAVYEDQFIAADPDFQEVRRMARAKLGERMALLFYQAPANP